MRSCFKHTALSAIAILMLGCATIRPVPVETNTQVQTIVKDSVVVHRDTVTLEVPIESSSAYGVQYSHLESSVAYSDASVDSTGLLNHTLTNKPFKIEKEIIYQDRKVETVRDSIVTKEIPVEVEVIRKVVPKWCWYLLAFNLICLIAFGFYLYQKLKKSVSPLP